MGTSTKGSNEIYRELAELARANVSGPMGYQFVAQAQRRLVDSMRQKGLINDSDADYLKL